MGVINGYIEYLFDQWKKDIITEDQYNNKISTIVELKLYIDGNRQYEKNGLWRAIE